MGATPAKATPAGQNTGHRSVTSSRGISYIWPLMLICVVGGMTIAGVRLMQLSQSTAVTVLAPSEIKILGHRSSSPRPKVLLVHSYHPEYEWVASVSFGVKKALSGSNAEIETFYMDTKRNTTEAWKKEMGRQALTIVEDWQPDVVIAADDNAQAYFARHLAGENMPNVVFCGVNRKIETYGYPQKNITGLIEVAHVHETLQFVERLIPGSKHFLLLSDNSPTSIGVVQHVKSKSASKDYTISYRLPSNFEEWKQTVQEYNNKVDAIAVYTYHTLAVSKTSARKVSPREVLSWTLEHSHAPVFGLLSFTVDAGALGGVVESGSEHGFEAGEIALQLLAGHKASEIPVRSTAVGKTMVNFDAAERFDISIPGREIVDRDAVLTGW